MKTWPDGNKPANFEDLVKPFKSVLRFAYKMTRQNKGRDIPYNGYEHGALHICFPLIEKFTANQMRYDEEEQGRDALEVIIGAILQVGIEQGRRIAMESSEVQMLRTQANLAKILMEYKKTVDSNPTND